MNVTPSLRQLVALKFVKNMTARSYRNGVMAFGSVNDLLGAPASEWARVEGLSEVKRSRLDDPKLWQEADREIERCFRSGVQLLTQEDAAYPSLLKEIYDPPFLLYVKGSMPPDSDIYLALVGSRDASSHGIRMAEVMGRELAAAGAVIVSGLALGVDGAAHRGALEGKGRTLAVLGSGLSRLYPPGHKKLSEQILSSGGAVISEFSLETGPETYHFPIRNRIISGMSRAVVVVEAREKSGALITADCALEQGRDVYAVPANAEQTKATGSNLLLGQGAKLALGSKTLIEDFGLKSAPGGPSAAKRKRVALEREEERLLAILKKAPQMQLDEILEKGAYAAGDAMVLLTKLTVKGVVKELPGKYFTEADA